MKKLLLFVMFASLACKQGKGDRCQVADDCAPPLACNMATNTCQETSTGGLDALPPDGPKIDARVDAPPDGMGSGSGSGSGSAFQ